MKHPAGQAAIKAAELVAAGKADEAFAMRSTEEVATWQTLPAAEKDDARENLKQRNPEPKAFAKAIRQNGELAVTGERAVLKDEMPTGKAIAYLEQEGNAWKISSGPMLFAKAPAMGNETRIQNADILKHPIGTLALRYVELVHAGKFEEARGMATAAAQERWKQEPASEKKESNDYLKKMLPTKAELTAGLQSSESHSVLIIEDGKTATLNLVRSEASPSSGSGTVSSSSSTTAIGFAMEGGQWKLAQ